MLAPCAVAVRELAIVYLELDPGGTRLLLHRYRRPAGFLQHFIAGHAVFAPEHGGDLRRFGLTRLGGFAVGFLRLVLVAMVESPGLGTLALSALP
jgi:hypothetical protein